MKILTNQNFNGNEIQNVSLHKLGTAPASPVKGQVYFSTAVNRAFFWNGAAWIGMDTVDLLNNSVTFSKFQQITSQTLVGRAQVGTGNAEEVAIVGSGATTVTWSSASSRITVSSTDTATINSGILEGSNSGTNLTYQPYATDQSASITPKFYTSDVTPVGESLLSLSARFRATDFTGSRFNGVSITPSVSKTLDLSVASLKVGTGTNTGSITITSSGVDARILTLGQSITLNADASRTLTINTANKTIAGAGTTLTFGGNFTTSGSGSIALTSVGATNVTLPTTGTLATLAGSEDLTNKSVNGLTITTVSSKTLDLSRASLQVGTDGKGGNIIVTSNSATARTLTLAGSPTIAGGSTATFTSSANIISPLTIGASSMFTGGVTVTSNGSSSTIIRGPNGGTVVLVDGTMVETSDSRLHNQNTDTGTTQTSFLIDSGNNGIRLKHSSTELHLRNSGDTEYADLRVKNLFVEGSQTVINSNEVNIGDNEIVLNSDITTSAENSSGGVAIKRLKTDNVTRADAKIGYNNISSKWETTQGDVGSTLITAQIANKVSFNVGDASKTSFALTHNLKSRDLSVTIRENASPYAMVLTDIEFTTINTITVRFAEAPALDAYSVTIIG